MSNGNAIGFAGLSHLGIIYSVASAARGFSVVAADERPGLAADLSAGRFPIAEPGLEETFGSCRQRIRFTGDLAALSACRLIFITLDVITDESNQSDLGPLGELINRVIAVAAPGSVIVLMSQVPPGFCRRLVSLLPAGLQFFYQVETLIFGNALERALRPERFMVGGSETGGERPEVYRQYLEAFGCPVLPMRYESAELCKIAINCFLVSSVSTSNTLAELCEKIGADWLEIVPALRLDRRIGPHAYLMPGLGIAGGNLERDLATVQRLAAEFGSDARVVTAWQRGSAYRRDWVLRRLFSARLLEEPDQTLLGLWGLTYKPGTHSTKNSPSLGLLRTLSAYRWLTYDPVAKIDCADLHRTCACQSALDAARTVDALIIMTPWSEFSSVDLRELRGAMRGQILVDPYGALDGDRCRALGFTYHRLGSMQC